MQPIHVLKLGSSVLRSEADLPVAVREVYRLWRAGHRVVAVPSAFGPTTDDLLKRAEQLGLPPQREASATLLATALDRSGIPVTLFDPAQIALLTLDVPRLLQALAHGVVVVPGFADLTALFLARELGGSCTLLEPHRPRAPLRVALLGCGTVGGGVLAHLLAQPDLFHVTGVLVRDAARPRDGAPRHLFTAEPEALFAQEADVVVELLGGRIPARELIVRALGRGRHVVSANKALLADEIGPLSALAASRGVSLRYSASVGGALPALEAVSRIAAQGRIRRFAGVLNGTSSFVLDRLGAGLGLAAA